MEYEELDIAVIGAGFVGLTAAVVLADMGHRVTCSDLNVDRINSIKKSIAPFYEPGLPELLSKVIANGSLTVTSSNIEAITSAKIIFLCLPTPSGSNDEPDMTAVKAVISEIEEFLEPETIVVTKSTAPIGWGESLTERLRDKNVYVVSNPEFLSEGNAIKDFQVPDRVLIGSDNPEAAQVLVDLHEPLNAPTIVTSCTAAEMGKYVANSYLATRLSFFNEVSFLCDNIGVNVDDVLSSVGLDSRIGPSFMKPGPGWGGSCLPKDTLAFSAFANASNSPMSMVETARIANENHLNHCIQRIILTLEEIDSSPRIAQWGLAFKAGTDDVRYSPALSIANQLRDRGLDIHVFDPKVDGSLHGHQAADTAISVCDGANLLIVATEWPEFKDIQPIEISNLGISHVIDLRNILDIQEWESAGIRYQGVGRPTKLSSN